MQKIISFVINLHNDKFNKIKNEIVTYIKLLEKDDKSFIYFNGNVFPKYNSISIAHLSKLSSHNDIYDGIKKSCQYMSEFDISSDFKIYIILDGDVVPHSMNMAMFYDRKNGINVEYHIINLSETDKKFEFLDSHKFSIERELCLNK